MNVQASWFCRAACKPILKESQLEALMVLLQNRFITHGAFTAVMSPSAAATARLRVSAVCCAGHDRFCSFKEHTFPAEEFHQGLRNDK